HEIPETAAPDAVLEDDASSQQWQRRVLEMASERHWALELTQVVTRDAARTLARVAGDAHCRWIVMEAGRRLRGQTVLPFTPLGWLVNHLDANLALFHDAGVRYWRRILVVVEPGPHDSLVATTAAHLAERWGAELQLGRHVRVDIEGPALQQELDYLSALQSLVPYPTRPRLIRGTARRGLAAACQDFDLVVLGTAESGWKPLLRGDMAEYIAARGACSVLDLRTPRRQTHAAYRQSSLPPQTPASLCDWTAPTCIGAKITAGRKDALFQRIAADLTTASPGMERKAVLAALWQREGQQSTSVGQGVALPHATLPTATHTHVAVYTLARPIDYHGPDGAEVDVVLATLSPPGARELHLQLLCAMAELAADAERLTALRHAADIAAIEAVLRTQTAPAPSIARLAAVVAHDNPPAVSAGQSTGT
ncbi:MAG: PTS sugar transporter subunit IIA, partial [Polyangiales bacterium]